eukprot:scaffold323695_cov30-Prasinocladus_malaysianus.AAC.1
MDGTAEHRLRGLSLLERDSVCHCRCVSMSMDASPGSKSSRLRCQLASPSKTWADLYVFGFAWQSCTITGSKPSLLATNLTIAAIA